jgi:hypothetical protein
MIYTIGLGVAISLMEPGTPEHRPALHGSLSLWTWSE